jgi:hypothetical protein
MAADRHFARQDNIQDSYWHKIDQVLARFFDLLTSQPDNIYNTSVILLIPKLGPFRSYEIFCRSRHARLCFPLPFPHSNLPYLVKPIIGRIDPNPNHFFPILKGKHSILLPTSPRPPPNASPPKQMLPCPAPHPQSLTLSMMPTQDGKLHKTDNT